MSFIGATIRFIVILGYGFIFVLKLAFARFKFDKDEFEKASGTYFCCFLESAGGALPKLGQILGTRADLLSQPLRDALAKLQDETDPVITSSQLSTHEKNVPGYKLDPVPIASATIAQVHIARSLSERERTLAIKIRRPDVARLLSIDCKIIVFFGKFVARLAIMNSIPINLTLIDVSTALISQTDFLKEAENHKKLYSMFLESEDVMVPKLVDEFTSENIIAMEYIPHMKKILDPELGIELAKPALNIGLKALYKMIFDFGFLHCDMHPGNMLVAEDGKLVLLDAGFMVEIDAATKKSFTNFFLAIGLVNGAGAAEIVRSSALTLPAELDINKFDADITKLIVSVGGLSAQNFRIAEFVSKLFEIMRDHHVLGTSKFSLIILSLLVFEGTAKQLDPELDFQKVAIPFVISNI